MKKLMGVLMVLCMVLRFSTGITAAVAAEEAEWQTEHTFATERNFTASALIDGKFYVISGTPTLSALNVTNQVDIIDVETNIPAMGNPIPIPVEVDSFVVYEESIYILGGLVASSIQIPTTAVQIYNTETNTWAMGQPMPQSSTDSAAAVLDGKIYVAAGNNMDVYDIATDTWIEKITIPIPVDAGDNVCFAQTVGERIYVIRSNSSTQIYNPVDNTWSTGASMNVPRSYASSVVVGSSIYVLGNLIGANDNTTSIYDTVTNTWSEGPELDSTFFIGTAIYDSGNLYLVGGYGSNTIRSLYLGEEPDPGETDRLSVLLEVGETVRLSVSYNPSDLSEITFTSADPSIAVVDANGIVTAVSEGVTEIYAVNADGTFRDSISIKVIGSSSDMFLLAVRLQVGETTRLYITDEFDKVTWTSLDESIAVVSASGQVTAISEGVALIQAVYEDRNEFIYVRVEASA